MECPEPVREDRPEDMLCDDPPPPKCRKTLAGSGEVLLRGEDEKRSVRLDMPMLPVRGLEGTIPLIGRAATTGANIGLMRI